MKRPAKCHVCSESTDHISGYCSDACVQADHDYDAPPVLVLGRNKANGFGTDLHWGIRTPVVVPPQQQKAA